MQIAIELDLTRPHEKYLLVQYTVSGITEPELVLSYPTWSPGSYLIREYESQVEGFAVSGANGAKLPFEKINKSQWRIVCQGHSKITVNYRVYANELNVRAVYSDHEMVFLNPTAAFFYPDGALKTEVSLKIKALSGWFVELAQKAQQGIYHFKDFDGFFDTPVLCAQKLEALDFKVHSTQYRIVFWGRHCAKVKKIAQEISKIVAKQALMFGKNPCAHYLFQVIFVEKQYGGLEHSFSSTNIFDGMTLDDEKNYKKFLALLSHEHFHLWNVKRIRPRELGPFDYQRENYTKELWMAEGITSYYDDHFVLRAGYFSQDAYLALLAENITKLEANKAVQINSIADSSFDSWIRFYRQNENAINTITSYYLKGGLVVMLLDFQIIKATKGRRNFDDVMRALNKIYEKRPELGFTRKEVVAVLDATAQVSFEKFFSDYIDGVKPIEWQKEFAVFGIEVKKTVKDKNGFLGFVLAEQNGKVTVQNIAEDSPAHLSILQPGDEILAFNHERVTSTRHIERCLKLAKVHIIFSRLGKVHEAELKLAPKAKPTYSLTLKKKTSPLQKKFLKYFLRKK